MTNLSIKTFNGSIQNHPVQLINARELHEFLKIQTRFQDWIKRRIYEYKFTENLDFIDVLKFENVERGFFGNRQIEIHEYHITLDMAKELCMLERSELGQQARRYFIRMEKEAKALREALSVPTTQANAISVSKDRYIELLENENRLLRGETLNKSKRAANVPLSAEEKAQILRLTEQGVAKSEIALRLNRSKSAVRSVIRENVGE